MFLFGVTLSRLIFLFTIVAVFLFVYLADAHVFEAIAHALAQGSPWAIVFLIAFVAVTIVSLSFYYFCFHRQSATINKNLIPWLKLMTLSVLTSLIVCSVIIYVFIYFDSTFDITPNYL